MKSPEELAAAYALGALSAEEAAEYEAWLVDSTDAAADASTYSEVAASLGLAAEPVRPSEDLRSRLLAQVALTPQHPPVERPTQVAPAATRAPGPASPETPAAPPASPPVPAAPHALAAPETPAAPQTPAERRARSRWSRGTVLLAAAAASAALFVGGGVVGSLLSQDPRDDFAVAQATALAQLQAAADAEQAVTEMEGGGEVTLIWSAEQARSAIMVDEMPPAPEGKTYQLWYIRGGEPIPDATFEAAAQGKTWRVLDGAMAGGDAVGVTLEPEGGSQAPSSDPLVVVGGA